MATFVSRFFPADHLAPPGFMTPGAPFINMVYFESQHV